MSINEVQPGRNTIWPLTTPIRHKIDPPRRIPHARPVGRPIRPLKRAHHRPVIHLGMRRRALELVDDAHDGIHTPVPAAGHVERREEREAARGFGGGVGEAQLGERPRVGRANVEGEAVDAYGFGVVDVLGPLVGTLAVGETDL